MQTKVQGASGQQKMPNTQVVSLLNDQLLIMIRSWNGIELNQKIIDEIHHYMSSVEADLEVTSPFAYSEDLSLYANKIRIAMMIANYTIYHSDNKEAYHNGAEVAAIFKKNNEIAWATIGRFSIDVVKAGHRLKVYDSGSRFDDSILLPTSLLGLYRHPEIHAGALSSAKAELLEIKSVFGQHDSVWECLISDF